MVDHSLMKLGKHKPRHDSRVPRLSRYLKVMPPPPASTSYAGKLTTLGMMANDNLGDCTCAAVGHAVQTWTSQASTEQTISDADIIALYERFGYNPSNPASDQGAVEMDVLTSWLQNPVAGHSITAFASIDPTNLVEIKTAIYLMGVAYIGLSLPTSAQSQDIWDVPTSETNTAPYQPGSWGGHAVAVVEYDETGLTCITWGALKKMTWAFWNAYCDEAYAILSSDWQGAEGFDYTALTNDIADLKAGDGPPRTIVLTDAQIWKIIDAVQSKIDGASNDAGVVQSEVSTAVQAEWQTLVDFLNLPRLHPHP